MIEETIALDLCVYTNMVGIHGYSYILNFNIGTCIRYIVRWKMIAAVNLIFN